jgi:hypothetical protein
MIPAFALLMSAAGIGLLLREHPTPFAFWLACVGMGLYLGGTHASLGAHGRWCRGARVAVTAVTYAFGALHFVLSPAAYLCVLAAWGAANVALTAWISRGEGRGPLRPGNLSGNGRHGPGADVRSSTQRS